MKKKIILITKEILRTDYLPAYGNTYWKTPNIDKLAADGTIFRKHYTNAPSTAMAVTCMFSGLQAHELERRYYSEVESFNQCPTIFDDLSENGYSNHVVWTEGDHNATFPYSKCYGEKTIFHKPSSNPDDFMNTISKITDEKLFLWIHLPTILGDRPSLGSDIDLLDTFVGNIRSHFKDADLYFSADHGHMNLDKGIPVYGFHVYNGAIHVPFITPRINNCIEIDFPTSHSQFKKILFEKNITKNEYIYSDTQYYLQAQRKIAIIKDNYKYIYNKYQKTEEFYDLSWDPAENLDLIPFINKMQIVEPYRSRKYYLSNIYFYPFLTEAEVVYKTLKFQKKIIWKEGNYFTEYLKRINVIKKYIIYYLTNRFLNNQIFTTKV